MIEMRIRAAATALLCAALAAPTFARADEPQGDTEKYRLQVAPQDYQLRADPAYQLTEPYRRPVPPPADAAVPIVPTVDLSGKPYAQEIELAALAASVDPALVHAVIQIESGYRHGAISPKGALGLMQVMPQTAARYGVGAARPTAKANIKVGIRYLRDLIGMFGDRLDLVLAAYNAGEGAVRRYSDRIPPYPETQAYVRMVLAKYAELGGHFPRAKKAEAKLPKLPLRAEGPAEASHALR